MERAQRLNAAFHPKVWGSHDLRPWFEGQRNPAGQPADRPYGEKIGEVWFTGDPRPPLLVKFLFTEERLSVQVHPGGPDGKTEMWHILRAGPRAEVALGFIRELTAAELREASVSGEVERLLRWFPVTAGDTIFVPAGTVHAIGADLALCEIQQYSDVTYRLYDYGRPRELHLDAALPISHLGAHPSPVRPAGEHLVSCEYFETSRLSLTSDRTIQGGMAVILDGAGTIDDQPCARGQAWQIPGQSCLSGQLEVLVTRVP